MANKHEQKSAHPYIDAFNKGVEIGNDLNAARANMRVTIAHRVRTLRMSKKLTQEELANQINANHLTYRGYENCRSDIPIAYLVRIADVFDVSLDYLTGRTDDMAPVSNSNAAGTDARIAQLEKMVAQLVSAQNSNS